MKENELENKAWFRFLKVLYLGGYAISMILLLIGAYIGSSYSYYETYIDWGEAIRTFVIGGLIISLFFSIVKRSFYYIGFKRNFFKTENLLKKNRFLRKMVRGLIIFLYDFPLLAIPGYVGLLCALILDLLNINADYDTNAPTAISLILYFVITIYGGKLRGRSWINSLFFGLGILNIQLKAISPEIKNAFKKYREGSELIPKMWRSS